MNFEVIVMNPGVQVLGSSLLHFLWQGLLLAMLVWLAHALIPASHARARYAVGCLVMLLMPVTLALTAAWSISNRSSGGLVSSLQAPAALYTAAGRVSGTEAAFTSSGPGLLGWAVCIWLAGVLALSIRAAGGWVRARRLTRKHIGPVSAECASMLERLTERLRISRPVRLCASAAAEVPAVIGWMRPCILLPVAALSGLSEQELSAILAHELAHIRRHDYIVNLLQTAVETLLFYHPAVWWLGRRIRQEREYCCDDIAVAACGNATAYAGALAQLEELRGTFPKLALAASGGQLLGRIRRLVDVERPHSRISAGSAIAAVLVLALAGAPVLMSLRAAPQQTPAAKDAPPEPKGGGVGKGLGGGIGAGTGAGIGRGIGKFIAPAPGSLPELPDLDGQVKAALAQADVRISAASLAFGNPSGRGVALLIRLYDTSQDRSIKQEVLGYLAGNEDPKARQKLLSVAQSDPDPQLRMTALESLSGSAENVDTLLTLYQNAKDVEIKRAILGSLAGIEGEKVDEKLLSIAQSDPDPELRREAVGYLAGR